MLIKSVDSIIDLRIPTQNTYNHQATILVVWRHYVFCLVKQFDVSFTKTGSYSEEIVFIYGEFVFIYFSTFSIRKFLFSALKLIIIFVFDRLLVDRIFV